MLDREARVRFANVYDEKYAFRPDPDTSLVYVLRPRVAHTWSERDFPGTAARWVLD